MAPEPPKYFSEFQRRAFDKGAAQGEAEGEAKGEAKAVLKILAQRGLAVTDDQRLRIAGCTDLAVLDRWLDRAFSISSVDELLR